MGKLYTYHSQAAYTGFIKRRLLAFGYALRGIWFCCTTETHFRLQGLVGLLAIASGLLLGLSKWEWVVVVLCIALVMALEAINTAIEHLCNIVCNDYNPFVKRVKDVAAGAVLIAAIGSCAAGLFIFLPKLFSLFQ